MRIAAIANAGASHQMTMCAIGRELQNRGHEFLLLGTEFQAKQLKVADIPLELPGVHGRDPAIEYMKNMAVLLCDEAPAVLRRKGIEFVLADQEEPGAATAAELVNLSYASICSSFPLNEGEDIPPGFLSWQHSPTSWAEARNRAAGKYPHRIATRRSIAPVEAKAALNGSSRR